MPGAGKSTVGVLLAKVSGFSFIDTDVLIQSRENLSLQQIMQNSGEKRFRELEEMYVCGLNCKKTIVATGGSVVYSNAAMENLSRLGSIVYLEAPFHLVRQRVKNMAARGVVGAANNSLKQIYDTRKPLYEKWADMSIPTEGLDQEQVLEHILHSIESLKQNAQSA